MQPEDLLTALPRSIYKADGMTGVALWFAMLRIMALGKG